MLRAGPGHVPRGRLRVGRRGHGRVPGVERLPEPLQADNRMGENFAPRGLPLQLITDQLQLRGEETRRREQHRAELHPILRKTYGRRALDGRRVRGGDGRRYRRKVRQGRRRPAGIDPGVPYDSWPSHDDVGGFFFEFELFRTASGPSRRVRETAVASMASSRDSAAATPPS